jgi:hypothetical protein
VFCSPSSSQLTLTSCDSILLNNQTYYTSGTYLQTVTNAAGCDSAITINATINQSTASILNEINCGDYVLNGQTYNSSGTYTQTTSNAAGCDSSITLNLTIETFDLTIQNNLGQLWANQTNVNYQWYDCDAQILIPGATNQVYSPSLNGNYAAILQSSNCADTTDCFTFIASNIDNNTNLNYQVYPNPNKGQFQIRLDSPYEFVHIDIYNMQGALILEQSKSNSSIIEVQNSELATGLYILNVTTDQNSKKNILVIE